MQLRSFNGLKLEHIALKFDINKQNELDTWEEVANYVVFNANI